MRVKCRFDGELQCGRRLFAAVYFPHPAETTGRLLQRSTSMKFNTKTIIRLALFAAISIILGKYLQIPIGDSIRISFENLSIILAGYLYGPFAGALCGAVADLLGCLFKGYAINPLITFAAIVIGTCAGIFGKRGFFKKPKLCWIAVCSEK